MMKIKGAAEKENFFERLLHRLNSLTDRSAKFISRTTSFDSIRYGAEDQKGGGYSVPGSIKYTRNFNNESDFFEARSNHIDVRLKNGYTGFTFDQVEGPRCNDIQKPVVSFKPKRVMVAVDAEDLEEILEKHKKLGELDLAYKPSVEEFFRIWTWPIDNKTYWIDPEKIPNGNEREFVISYRGLDRDVVREVEEKFPEAKGIFDALVEEIENNRENARTDPHHFPYAYQVH